MRFPLPARLAIQLFAAVLAATTAFSQTRAFTDAFAAGSTINASPLDPAAPTSTAASYQQLSAKGFNPNPPAIADGQLRFGIVSTSSGFNHVQALFTAYPVVLDTDGDSIEVQVTFSSEGGILTAQSNSTLFLGLFNAGQIAPVPGGLAGSVATAREGNAQTWQGYVNRVFYAGGSHGFYARSAQGPTASNNQDVLYNFSGATAVGSTVASTLDVLTANQVYTSTLRITKASATSLQLDGALYAGATATGTPLYTQSNTSSSILTDTFDAFAFGYRSTASQASVMAVRGVRVLTTGNTTIKPEFLTQPLSQTKTVGEAVTLVAEVDGGPGTTTTFQWRKNGEDLAGETQSSLTFAAVAETDAGDYTLLAHNVAGDTVSAVATLGVTTGAVPPSILVAPAGATLTAGAGHTFSVVADGTAPLAYQWEKQTGDGDFVAIEGATGTSLTLAVTTLADAGVYRVVVTNGVGSTSSEGVTLAVQSAPVFTTQPTGSILNPGGALTLTAAAAGTPAPAYQWFRNGVALSGATNASFAIAGATGADAGNYTVTATNDVGAVTSAVAAVVVVSPTLATTALTPTTEAGECNRDTRLQLTFNAAVTLGVSGKVQIHDAADGTVVDEIDLVTATAKRDQLRLGGTLATQLLPVQSKPIGAIPNDFNYYPLTVDDATATVSIYPRDGVLAYGKSYYVTVDAGVVLDAQGEAFAGIGDASVWTFTVKANGPAAGTTRLVVAADGSGDFDTLQAAIDWVPAGNTTPTTILVRAGTYFEQIAFQSKHFLTIVGEAVDDTVIAYPNNNTFNNISGYYHRSTVLAHSVHDLTLANLTIRNTTPQGGTQAEAIVLNGSGATSAHNLITGCKFYSYQDTVQFNAQTYVVDSTIHGDVDFLWGTGPVYLENCDIRIFRAAGYFTQIRNGSGNHGYVFRHCRFSAPEGVTGTFLGRIDPAFFPFSEVVVLDSTVGDAVNNNLLATATGVSSANYQAGWWLLNNAGTANGAATLRYWDQGVVDGNAAALTNPNDDPFTTMPADEATAANYRDPAWVLNTTMDGTATGSWTPALVPVLAVAPAPQTVGLGEAVTLRAVVVAVPAATFQWYKDGDPIEGATGASYVIPVAAASDVGSYTVVADNGLGQVTSNAVAVTVGSSAVPPTITEQPAGAEVLAGAGVRFSVAASGSQPFTYQWRRNGDPIAGATEATYVLAATTVDSAGDYSVVVSNSAGSATSAVAVLVVNAPVIGAVVDDTFADGSSTNQDLANDSLQIFNGRSANTRTDSVGQVAFAILSGSSDGFWANFTEAGAPIELAPGDRLAVSVTFSVGGFGGTGQDIRFGVLNSKGTRNTVNLTGGMNTSSFADDQGYGLRYVASTSSTPFTLFRRNLPGATANPNNPFNSMNATDWAPLTESVLATGDTASLADGPAYTLTYTLARQSETAMLVQAELTGGDLPADYRIEAVDSALDQAAFDSFGFRIPNATFATGVTFSRVLVVVHRAVPAIALQPQFSDGSAALTLTIGGSTALSVGATGAGLRYQWYRDGAPLDGATAGTLVLENVQADAGGSYTVEISNDAGSVTSDAIILTVSGSAVAPTVTVDPLSQVVPEGTETTLTVEATGSTPFTYQWQKDGVDLPGETRATLVVSAPDASAAGDYRVIVHNSAGDATSAAATLTVKGVPAIVPTGFAADVTGGAAGETVIITNATDLKTYAESTTTPYTIIVRGTIDLGDSGRIKLQSDKTLRGETVRSTILGTVNISNAHNVIVANLNISANTGAPATNDGVTIAASTRVLVTKCSIYDCTDGNLDVINGSDLVTVSWCKFYYTRDNGHNFSNLIGSSDTDTGAGDGRSNYRVTWQNNWWAPVAKQRMLACRFGQAHMVNNYWDCAGNDYGCESRNIAQVFAEHNAFDGIDDPLNKRLLLENDMGLLKTLNNLFVACTGAQLESDDVVFTPPYSYALLDAAAVKDAVRAGAGNTIVDVAVAPVATVTAATTVLAVGGSTTLRVDFAGGTPTGYQWRHLNRPIVGATAATLELSAVTLDDAGAYSVVLTGSGDQQLVSAPVMLEVYPTSVAPVIATAPVAQTGMVGDALHLGVEATSSAPATYQWRRNGEAIAGATQATLSFGALTAADTGFYDVVITNAFGSVTSTPVLVSVTGSVGGAITAGQAVVGHVYRPGGLVTVNATLVLSAPATDVAWQVLLPTGWSFESADLNETADSAPITGDTVLAEWHWSSLAAGAHTFRYALRVPVGMSGLADLVALVEGNVGGSVVNALAAPDPLTLVDATRRHSADTNGDARIDLSELLRVIQLYNTRAGTVRTGAYHAANGTVDGFESGEETTAANGDGEP